MGSTFQLAAPFAPAGDQPGAIRELSEGLAHGLARQVLLGVTGSGKTYTMASVIAAVDRPALVIAPNKTLAAQLYSEFKSLFPENAVEYFVSYYDYYQPEAYVPHTDTYIEKDSAINEQIDKMRHSATRSVMTRGDVIVIASVSCIYGLGSPEYYAADDRPRRGRRGVPPQRAPAAADRPAVRAQRRGLPPRNVARPRRRGGAVPRVRGREGPSDRVRRGPDRPDPPRGPPPGDADQGVAGNGHLPGQPLRDAGGSARAGGPRDRGGARRAARGAPRAGKAARGGAAEAEDHLRPRDDLPDGILLRHRELLPPSRRARPRPAAVHAPRLLPEGVRHLPRRVPRDRSPVERDVQRRPVPETDAGGFRVPAPLRARQPAAPVRGVQRPGGAGDLRLGDSRGVRTAGERRGGGGADHPPHGARRPRDRGPPRADAGGRSSRGDPEKCRRRGEGPGHDPHEADGRRSDGALRGAGSARALPPLRHRHHGAGRDPAGPSARDVRRSRRDQPAPGGARPPGGLPGGDPRRRQGRVSPLRPVARADVRPRRAQRVRKGHPLRGPGDRVDAGGDVGDGPAEGTAGGVQPGARDHPRDDPEDDRGSDRAGVRGGLRDRRPPGSRASPRGKSSRNSFGRFGRRW